MQRLVEPATLLDAGNNRPPTLAWSVVNTHTHREQTAVEHLQRQGFEAYCPMVARRIRHARQVKDVTRPMFPGYVFARVGLDRHAWRPMLSTYGVRSVICCGDRPSLVDDGFVSSLKAREVGGLVSKPSTPFQVGQSVRVAGGPFDGLVATIIDMNEKDRVVLLMGILNGSVRVKVDIGGISETS